MACRVVVVGAGPTGLTACVALATRGVECRVVDRRPRRDAGTGCHMLWPRTLEALDVAGLPVRDLARRGIIVSRKEFHLRGSSFSHGLTDPGSLWPLPVSVEQAVLEDALARRLRELGVAVEWRAEALDVIQNRDRAEVIVRRPAGLERIAADWVILAQGGTSRLSGTPVGWTAAAVPAGEIVHLDVKVPEGTDQETTDQETTDRETTEHIFLGRGGTVGLVPLPHGRHRLFTVAGRDGLARSGRVDGRAVAGVLREAAGFDWEVQDLGQRWRFTPRLAIAATFGSGRCFLAGESAKHAPMPVHGMNGGIQDAANLSWKLAAVAGGEVGRWLLDTYTTERRAAAADAFAVARRVVEHALAADPAAHRDRLRRGEPDVRTEPVARYLGEPLHRDEPAMSGPRAGEHLPEAPLVASRGAATTLLRSVLAGWTVVAFTDRRRAGTAETARLKGLAAHLSGLRVRVVERGPGGPGTFDLRDPDGAAHRAVGATGPRLYVVRPDGHIGFRGPLTDLDAVRDYLTRLRTAGDRPAAENGPSCPDTCWERGTAGSARPPPRPSDAISVVPQPAAREGYGSGDSSVA